jgi:hypothetical protein
LAASHVRLCLLESLKAYLDGFFGVDLLIVIQAIDALLPTPVVQLSGCEAARNRRRHAYRHI